MKIKTITLNKFKRFTDLVITNIPETAKLIILVGPNGCGKTSLFDALNYWYNRSSFSGSLDETYFNKIQDDDLTLPPEKVKIEFHSPPTVVKGKMYFRTAHRNEPDFTATNLNKQENPANKIVHRTLMENDACVSSNYQRLVSTTLAGVFDETNNQKTVGDLREELVGRVKTALNYVFEDLSLSSIGDPLQNGSFYFTKGKSKNFHYKNLSAGEKSAFDIMLDLIIKSTYYKDAIYCIDEPETHMHTSLQSKLLSQLYRIMTDNSQLWLATHSIGMLKKAKELESENPGSVVFINFSDIDFDTEVILKPSQIDATIWSRFLGLAFGELSNLIAPERIVFCEGNQRGRKNKNFDSVIYSKIFNAKYPTTSFVSIGSCSEIEDVDNVSMQIIANVLSNSIMIKLVDRDDKSAEEIKECNDKGVKVLNHRHIECYLLDDEIIRKLCDSKGLSEKMADCLDAKNTAIQKSQDRGNAPDDIKSAAGDIYSNKKNIRLNKVWK